MNAKDVPITDPVFSKLDMVKFYCQLTSDKRNGNVIDFVNEYLDKKITTDGLRV